MRNIPHMTTCGNNDLVEKKYGFAFNHYATYEDVPKFSDLGGASEDEGEFALELVINGKGTVAQ